MTHTRQHADDSQLSVLLIADEDSAEYRAAAAHVETCEMCRSRLERMSGTQRFDDMARELLSDYPAESISRESRARRSHADQESTTPRLDFLSPPSHPEMLGRLGRYEIEQILGTGGMGIVLKAFDTELNRPVAIKVLARHLAHSGAARQRFTREAKAAAAVVHEHVVAIHNVEAERDMPFLVMQYVAGESLQTRVDREGPLDVKQILRIGVQAAAGLAAAHEQGVIHRDIKPANILLENGVERVLLTDFGLARTVDDASLTHTGIVSGTPHYMSPEQAGGETTDHRTDLFSLGCVLYFMATGHPPFRAERAMGVLHRICHDTQRAVWELNAEIPDELSEIIDQLLQKKPSRRFASAAEVRDALARLLSRMQQRGLRRSGRLWRFARRHRTLTALCCGLVLALAAAAPMAWQLASRVASDTSRAQVRGRTTNADSTNANAPAEPALRAELDSELMSLRDVAEQIERIQYELHSTRFVHPEQDAFTRDVQALERRLNRLDEPWMSSFSNP